MEFHELTSIFPLMTDIEFNGLIEDIRQNGQLEPILIQGDKIIDGRNRWRACEQLGITPRTAVTDSGDIQNLIISLNLHRRHLNESQRAVIASRLANMPAHRPDNKSANLPTNISQPKAAEMLNISERSVRSVAAIEREKPELIEQIEQGKITVTNANRIIKKEGMKIQALPEEKYRVIYADPPWQYNDSGIINDDNYGRAERHYPTMPINELIIFGDKVKEIVEENAVLFLWTTSPILEDAFKIIKGWGFEYKTSFVWDKIKHNFGHYNSVRHEFLLVATKGSCTPDSNKKIDSVQSIERSEIHSEKPEEFRTIIDQLYTNGKKMELFSRKRIDGWDTWGNEIQTNLP